MGHTVYIRHGIYIITFQLSLVQGHKYKRLVVRSIYDIFTWSKTLYREIFGILYIHTKFIERKYDTL